MIDKCSPRGWNSDTLEAHLSSVIATLKERIGQQDQQNVERFAAAKEQFAFAMASAERALTKAETANDKRFDGVNEFRATLADQSLNLMPRAEYAVQHQGVSDKISDMNDRMVKLETAILTKSEAGARSVATIVAVISVAYGIIASVGIILTLVLRH